MGTQQEITGLLIIKERPMPFSLTKRNTCFKTVLKTIFNQAFNGVYRVILVFYCPRP